MAEVAAAGVPELSGSIDKRLRKSSKSKEETTSKKRHREVNQTEKAERKHKKSRSDAAPALGQATKAANGNDDEEEDSAPKRKRKADKSSKRRAPHVSGEERSQEEEVAPASSTSKNDEGEGGKRSDKKKTRDRESRKSKKSREKNDQVLGNDDEEGVSTTYGHPDLVVLNSSRSTTFPNTTSSKHQYPFYTQTVSQYLPLHPLGISEPIQGYVNQHIEPLLNRYVPNFGGVLLAYRHPRIGEAPGSNSLAEDSAMDAMAVFESINEHAVSFGWLTVEIDIFRPSRGAWLEGLVNIQSGGHVGVVCWSKFNASIEAERLPRDWRWVDQHSSKGNEDSGSDITPSATSPQDKAEADHAEVHTTGYWVDGQGTRVAADTPVCFRIKNYEVGSSGDYGYLSIEGTMLTEAEEEDKVQEEMEALRHKLKHGVAPRRHRRALLDLSITKFANDDAKETTSQQAEV